MKSVLILFVLITFSFELKSQDILNNLSDYFEEYNIVSEKDNSNLWGISFNVPMIVATLDYIVTNREIEGFIKYKNIYYGKTDEVKPGMHGTISWKERKWAFYTYSHNDFEIKKKRLDLLFHEAFHYIQSLIDLEGAWSQCKHLNSFNARVLLKLEYEALLKAFKEENFKIYLIDAIAFRAYRYFLYPNAYVEEQKIEMQEGLAQYTGLKLCGYSGNEIYDLLQNKMTYNPQTFGYYSGAIYSFILDKSNKAWQKEIRKNDNFLYFTQKIFDLNLPENLKIHIERVRNRYNWKQISTIEKDKAQEIRRKEKKYIKMFFKKPIVKISRELCKGFGFSSSIIFPIEKGKIFNGVSCESNWGKLVAIDEIYISDDFVYLPTPFIINGKQINGNGWVLYLNDKWTIIKTSENYELIEK